MMSNSEQHEMLVGILCNLVPVLTSDELSLLAHSCGVPVSEFYGNTNNKEFEQSGFPAPIKSGFENGENHGIYRI